MLPLWYLISGVFLSIVSFAGNGIVIYLIVTRRRLHNPANWIILSLAVADFSACVGAFLTLCLHEVFSFEYNRQYSVISFLWAVSATNLCLMALDRYIFITKPLRYVALVTTRRAVFLISFVWIASFLSHFLFYLVCIDLHSTPPNCTRNFKIFDFAVFEILPMVILLFSTGHIVYIVRQRSRQTAVQMAQLQFNQRPEDNREDQIKDEKKSSVKIVGVAVAVFIICYIVELVYTVLYQFTEKEPDSNLMYTTDLLRMVNSAVNPVAYAFFKSDIKKSLRSMFCCNEGTPD